MRVCLDCPTSLEGEHGNRKRCQSCSDAKIMMSHRRYSQKNYQTNKARYRARDARLKERIILAKKSNSNKGAAKASDIVALRNQGFSYQKIGEEVGVTRERVRQILNDVAPHLVGPIL